MTAFTRALWLCAIGPFAVFVPGFFRAKVRQV